MDISKNTSFPKEQIQFQSQKEMEIFASFLAEKMTSRECLALHGEMGVGKSSFARAFIRARCKDPLMEVPSPTFALVQSYGSDPVLFHYDLWRLGDGENLEELGWDEAEEGIMLVEWPEHAGDYLPSDAIHLFLALAEEVAGMEEPPRVLRWTGTQSALALLDHVKMAMLKKRL